MKLNRNRLGYLGTISDDLIPIERQVSTQFESFSITPELQMEPEVILDTPIPKSESTREPFLKSSSILREPSKLPQIKRMPQITKGEAPQQKVEPPPPRDHLEVLLATFKEMLHLGYQAIEFAEMKAKEYGYVMDRELSTVDTYIYLNTETGFPLIVHRGSITATDWIIEDGLILSTLTDLVSSPRSIYARRITKKVEAKYKKPTDAFGHSLGGRLAEVSQANGYILTYNKAAGFQDIGKKINNKQYDFRTTNDIVSLLAQTQRSNTLTTIEDKGLVGSHALKHLSDEGVEIANP